MQSALNHHPAQPSSPHRPIPSATILCPRRARALRRGCPCCQRSIVIPLNRHPSTDRSLLPTAQSKTLFPIPSPPRNPGYSSRPHPWIPGSSGSSGLRSSRHPSTSAPARTPSPQLDAPAAFGHGRDREMEETGPSPPRHSGYSWQGHGPCRRPRTIARACRPRRALFLRPCLSTRLTTVTKKNTRPVHGDEKEHTAIEVDD